MSRRLTAPADFARLARPLSGRWVGGGHGQYPTLEDFDYREELELAMRAGDDTLRYDQRTWRLVDGRERASHWEVGLLRLDEGGRLFLHSAQNGRTEVMHGTAWETDDGALGFELGSVAYGGDPRMRASHRSWSAGARELAYEMYMATERVPRPHLHLQARLRRPE